MVLKAWGRERGAGSRGVGETGNRGNGEQGAGSKGMLALLNSALRTPYRGFHRAWIFHWGLTQSAIICAICGFNSEFFNLYPVKVCVSLRLNKSKSVIPVSREVIYSFMDVPNSLAPRFSKVMHKSKTVPMLPVFFLLKRFSLKKAIHRELLLGVEVY